MKSLRILLLLLIFVGVIGCQKASETLPPRDGVFLHIASGYDNPHRVLMALKMAEIMSDSKDVLIYFDIRGIEVVLKNSETAGEKYHHHGLPRLPESRG